MRRATLQWTIGLAAAIAVGAPPADAATKRVFLTSTTCAGILGPCTAEVGDEGVAAANNICQARAVATGLDAGGATFRAWLSDTTADAYCNVLGLAGQRSTIPPCGVATLPEAGPWELLDGIPFAESIAGLVDETAFPVTPLQVDDLGGFVNIGFFKSGSLIEGTYFAAASCGDWTIDVAGTNNSGGNADIVATDWISGGAVGCFIPTRVACFEQGAGDPLRYPSVPGALAFVTSTSGTGKMSSFPESGGAAGLDGADAACRARAAAAFLPSPNSFMAWLSDDTHDAALRLTLNGPWKRVDGVLIADSLADLIDARLWTPISLTESGARFELDAWTGTTPLGDIAPENCLNWASEDLLESGVAGKPWRAGSGWTQFSPFACSVPSHLYCFSNQIVLGWDNFETGNLRRWSSSLGAQ